MIIRNKVIGEIHLWKKILSTCRKEEKHCFLFYFCFYG